ncbi:PREDICTED: uncharacterized protein LOC105450683 [Wasmannia auropunctata]|uniref:uncharacterized protein LOC105450683 n=1 Tax=Wasmannia auropunctata TaxID=64793 RepID=UPI0005EE1459|nr:PREDICTED: uncharacterized protein LOC105450683 [Wasmannia auropunctata]XP_011688936.1 PREDICTED: uncharacterized protein LOC105450683 [Wasmannia auropunctata]
MMDPPRHTCRGRPIVCPGPCNPLKAHHHHHHGRHHHREKADVTEIVAPGRDIHLLDEYSQITLLRSLRTEASVTSVTAEDATSISRTTSSARIALIRIPKTPPPRDKKADVAAIIQQILPPEKLHEVLKKTGEPSTSKPRTERAKKEKLAFPGKIESARIPTVGPGKTPAAAASSAPPRDSNDVTACAFMTRLQYGLTRASPVLLCLTILMIYAGIHVLLAVIAWQTPAHQFFVSSQICGLFAFLMWQLTGTILI